MRVVFLCQTHNVMNIHRSIMTFIKEYNVLSYKIHALTDLYGIYMLHMHENNDHNYEHLTKTHILSENNIGVS